MNIHMVKFPKSRGIFSKTPTAISLGLILGLASASRKRILVPKRKVKKHIEKKKVKGKNIAFQSPYEDINKERKVGRGKT